MATKSSENATSNMNLYQKLAAIRKQVEVMKKNKAAFNYSYTSEDEILAKLTVQLDKLRLLCFPTITPDKTSIDTVNYKKTKFDKKTSQVYEESVNEVIVKGEMVFTWINIDNPEERLDVPWFFVGQQSDASMAGGSGLTYYTRYFFLKFFNIATTDDDPDNWRTKQKNAEAEEDKLITDKIIDTVDDLVKDYVTKSKTPDDAKAKVLDITNKYVKGGNYTKITDSKLAAKLLEELQKTLLKEEK